MGTPKDGGGHMGLLDHKTRLELTDTLKLIPLLQQPQGFGRLLDDLPDSLVASATQSGTRGIDLPVLVGLCNEWAPEAGAPHPLRMLIENAQALVKASAWH